MRCSISPALPAISGPAGRACAATPTAAEVFSKAPKIPLGKPANLT